MLACTLAALGPGCRQQKLPLANVTGQVTFNGVPAQAELIFQPVDAQGETTGRPSTALCGAEGLFTAYFAENEPGALVGPHRVTVRVFPAVGPRDTPSFDERFKAAKVVAFRRTIAASRENRFQFPLTY
jgi:hypothetical protein